jgi:hypothetical protein
MYIPSFKKINVCLQKFKRIVCGGGGGGSVKPIYIISLEDCFGGYNNG